MVALKLLYVLIWSCIAYGRTALDDEKIISEHLIPFEHKQDSRLDIKRSTETTLDEFSNSDYSGSLHKQKRNALKSILNGVLVKQRLATDRLVNGANIYSQQIQIPVSHLGAFSADQVISPDQPNPILIPVPYKSLPLCETASNSYVNGINSGISCEGILIKNGDIITCTTIYDCNCITSQSHVLVTKNPSPLNTIIQQNPHLIPLTTSTNFKPSNPLISNDNGYNAISPNNPIIPTHSDSIMQRNSSQIPPFVSNIRPPYDSPSNDNIDSTYNEPLGSSPCHEPPIEDEQSIIPEAPALLPLNPPNVVFPPSYNSFHDEEGNDILVVGSASSELSDCPQPSIPANDQPLVIPEAPALQPLNPPNTIFYPTNSNLNDEANEEIHRGDLSDPRPQFPTANIFDDEPIILENSDSVVPPSAPAYFPLNPSNNNNSPGYTLSDEYLSNIFSDNSESSDPLPCPESIGNQPINIPEAPALMPLNPPNNPIYPADYPFHKNENELSDSSPCPQFSTPIVVPEDEVPPLPDTTSPPSYFPLNAPDIQLPANTLDEYESNVHLDNSEPLNNLPCPQDTNSHEEPIEDLPIIPEAPHLMPLSPTNISSVETNCDKEINEETSQPLIPTPASYFPFNLPETPINVIDNDLLHISSENDKTPLEYPCPQTNLPSVIAETTPLPFIPDPPSYIPLNPPETLPVSDEHGILETNPCLETTNIKAEPIEDIPKNAPESFVPVNQPKSSVLQQQMTIPAIFHSPKVISIPEKLKEIRELKDTVNPNSVEYGLLDLPPCDPETSEDGIKAVIFEPKRCKKGIKVAIPTSVVRQPIRKRKILVKKRPTVIIKSPPRPIFIRKLKKSHVLRKD